MKLTENTIFITQLPKLVCFVFILVTRLSFPSYSCLLIKLILITLANFLLLNSLNSLDSDLKPLNT